MENWTKRIILIAGLCLPLTQAYGQDVVQVIEPELDRRVIKTAAIDTEDFEIGPYYGIMGIQDFANGNVIGLRAAYHATENAFFELTAGRSKGDLTSFELLSGGSPLLSDKDRDFIYYDLSLGWNVLPGEIFIGKKYAFNSSVYFLTGIGGTRFAGDDWFTFNLGAGFRLLLTDWIAWRIEVRDHIFDRDIFGERETTHNFEINTGFTVFF